MIYIVRTIDRCFTEAYHDSMQEVIQHWATEILAGTHYFIVCPSRKLKVVSRNTKCIQ